MGIRHTLYLIASNSALKTDFCQIWQLQERNYSVIEAFTKEKRLVQQTKVENNSVLCLSNRTNIFFDIYVIKVKIQLMFRASWVRSKMHTKQNLCSNCQIFEYIKPTQLGLAVVEDSVGDKWRTREGCRAPTHQSHSRKYHSYKFYSLYFYP